jgi:HEAT repeat protein
VTGAGPVARAADLAALGHRGGLTADDVTTLSDACAHDPDARVRAAALGALVRAGAPRLQMPWCTALSDGDAAVRRRACELAPACAAAGDASTFVRELVAELDDRDVTVVEAAAWALGELGDDAVAGGAVGPLADVARAHRDPLAREAAVAALGALGDDTGLPAILAACADKPAVRRRAVLALAPFDGPEVDAAIDAALTDRDWQVRQAAEDLRGVEPIDDGPATT